MKLNYQELMPNLHDNAKEMDTTLSVADSKVFQCIQLGENFHNEPGLDRDDWADWQVKQQAAKTMEWVPEWNAFIRAAGKVRRTDFADNAAFVAGVKEAMEEIMAGELFQSDMRDYAASRRLEY